MERSLACRTRTKQCIMYSTIYSLLIATILMASAAQTTAQATIPEDPQELEQLILRMDSTFWVAYNQCDTETMRSYLADDLEFYHDKGGLDVGGDKVIEGTKNGICRTPDFYLRREAVPGTVHVDPVPGHGAIIYGEHLFYVNEKGRDEYLDGQANFAHVWALTDKGWQMRRVLSYSHRAPEASHKEVKALSKEQLQPYTGTYHSDAFGEVTVTHAVDGLKMKAGKFEATLYPESDNLFFVKDRPLQFRFNLSGNEGEIEVIENGKLVDRAKRRE